MAQGLYNHSTIPLTREEEELQEMQERANEAAAAKAGMGASEREDNSDDDDDDDWNFCIQTCYWIDWKIEVDYESWRSANTLTTNAKKKPII